MAAAKGYNHIKFAPVKMRGLEYFRVLVTMPDNDMHDHFYALCPQPMINFITDILRLLGFTYEVVEESPKESPKPA